MVQALEALGELKPASLAEHVEAVVGRLDDHDGDNRLVAMQLLCKLKPSAIEAHASVIVKRLEDTDSDVRLTAMRALARLRYGTRTRFSSRRLTASALWLVVQH